MEKRAKGKKAGKKEKKASRKTRGTASSLKSIKKRKITKKEGAGMKETKSSKPRAKKPGAKILPVPKTRKSMKTVKPSVKTPEKKSIGIVRKSSPKPEIKIEEKIATPVVAKKSKIKKNELAQLKEEIMNERYRLIKEIDNLDNITHTNGTDEIIEVRAYSIHMAENASEIEAVNTALGLRKILVERLDQINDALSRIEEGNYGICLRCGCTISMERLLAKPQAVVCVDCRRREEAEKRGMMW